MKIETTTPPIGNPAAFKAAFVPYLDRAGLETARAMRSKVTTNKSILFSQLLNSIRSEKDGELSRFIGPAVAHARMVEEGTGPAAGKARYFPNFDNLVPFVKAHATRGGETLKRAGSRARFFQEQEFVNRAFGLARFIYWHGTKARPFAGPTAIEMAPRIHELLAQGVAAGAKAQLGGAP